MARENGYFSQKSFELYDTTGTTEDWSYNATGGFCFTFELYCGAPSYETGDCDDPAFHPRFATMAKEWDGTSAQADHGGYDGKGNREAFYIAAESTLNEARHAVLEGSAPPGARLTLTKDFKTDAFDAAVQTDDHLEPVLDVGDSGAFRWHVNPSTRPIVAKGSSNPGTPGAAQSASGTAAATAVGGFKDHAFTVPAGDNAIADFRVTWGTPASDLGHRAVPGQQRQWRRRCGRAERWDVRAGPDELRAARDLEPVRSVRAARDQLCRGRGLRRALRGRRPHHDARQPEAVRSSAIQTSSTYAPSR